MDYIHLMKPRSVLLLLVTALAGMVLTMPGAPSLSLVAGLLLAGTLAAGGANALNCYLDRELDRHMARTASRPLALGSIPLRNALAFGVALCALSVAFFGLWINWLSALLAATGVFYYVVVYTLWLKRASHWNIVVGGGAGALPILVGSAAGSGQVSALAVWLGAIVMCWTPPHFWSLALLRRSEYAFAGIPMLPVVKGPGANRRQIFGYSLLLFMMTLLVVPAGFAGVGFLAMAVALGGALLVMAFRLLSEATDEAARQLYRFSTIYLGLLFLALIADRASGWSLLLTTL